MEFLLLICLFLCLLASSVIKTMTARAVWQSCLRGVNVFAELLRNLRFCIIGLFVSKLPKPNNTSPLLRSRQPHLLLLLCSNLKESQQFEAVLRSLYLFRTCFCKRIGGSREPLARIYLHSSPNPSFGKGGTLAMEFLLLICLFLCLLASSVIKTMTARAVWQSCLRGVNVFAELLRNLRFCIIGLFVSKLPKPNNTSPLLRSRQPHLLLLLCSNLKESQQFWSGALQKSLFYRIYF